MQGARYGDVLTDIKHKYAGTESFPGCVKNED
jgi:hypothetical protein